MKPYNIVNEIKKIRYANWIGGLLSVISVILAAISVGLSFSGDIWYDELFTMGLTGHSFQELIGFTARDVHPPFYYMFVKVVRDLFDLLIPSSKIAADTVHAVIVGKICSVIPFVLLIMYALTKIRRNFGLLTAGIFTFCIVTMPQLSQYTTEIRMYSLALFLVTAAFLHAYDIVKEGKTKDFIYLTIYGILAAYTHYFACVAIALVYLYLLLWNLWIGRVGKLYKKWLACVGFSILAYLPWMYTVAAQVLQVKENYWILPLTFRSIGGCVKFLLKPSFSNDKWNVLIAVLLFAIYGASFFYTLWKNRQEKKNTEIRQEDGFLTAGLFILAGLTAFGFAASLLIRPVFIYRYMLPAMGCFWLCFAICIGRLHSKKMLFLPLMLLLLTVGLTDYKSFMKEELWKKEQMNLTVRELEQIGQEAAVVFNFNQMQGTLGYYLPNETYLWMQEPEDLIYEMFDNRYDVMSAEEIKSWLIKDRKVWFIGSGNAREDLLEEWKNEGIAATEKATCLLERYWFNLYELNMEK